MTDRTPHRYLLPTDTVLWRLHSQKVDATEFLSHARCRRLYRGRFDAESYQSYNAGLDVQTLVADLLLRGIPVSGRYRTVRRVRISGMRASAVSTVAELSLVSLLTSPALAAAPLKYWLLFAEESHGRIGREAELIRSRASWAHGFVWPAEHDRSRQLVVLFGDRCAVDVLGREPEFAVDLDDEYGAVWLNGLLAPHHARIMPPRTVQSATGAAS